MAISHTVSEIHRLIGHKSPNFLTPALVFGTPITGEAVRVKQMTLGDKTLE